MSEADSPQGRRVCPNVRRIFRGCKFKDVYDEEGPSEGLVQKAQGAWELPFWLAELLRSKRTYAGSVCVRCGRTVDKNWGRGQQQKKEG